MQHNPCPLASCLATAGPLPLRVRGVPEVAARLQRRAADALFQRLGIGPLPGVLLDSLREYDVTYALYRFCADFGVSFHALLDADDAGHAAARRRLEEVVGTLAAAERAARDTPLSVRPVVDALRASPAAAGALLPRLEGAAIVWRRLHASGITWPAFLRFRTDSSETLVDWAARPEGVLGRILAVASEYEEQHRRWASTRAEIRRRGDLLRSRAPRVRDAAARLAGEADALAEAVESGRASSDASLRRLEEILASLNDLAASKDEPDPKPGPSTASDPERVRCLALLGVADGASAEAIKKAYRTLAMRYHPDYYRGADATERMQEINRAYEHLRARFG